MDTQEGCRFAKMTFDVNYQGTSVVQTVPNLPTLAVLSEYSVCFIVDLYASSSRLPDRGLELSVFQV